jgi:hypothetical protein
MFTRRGPIESDIITVIGGGLPHYVVVARKDDGEMAPPFPLLDPDCPLAVAVGMARPGDTIDLDAIALSRCGQAPMGDLDRLDIACVAEALRAAADAQSYVVPERYARDIESREQLRRTLDYLLGSFAMEPMTLAEIKAREHAQYTGYEDFQSIWTNFEGIPHYTSVLVPEAIVEREMEKIQDVLKIDPLKLWKSVVKTTRGFEYFSLILDSFEYSENQSRAKGVLLRPIIRAHTQSAVELGTLPMPPNAVVKKTHHNFVDLRDTDDNDIGNDLALLV